MPRCSSVRPKASADVGPLGSARPPQRAGFVAALGALMLCAAAFPAAARAETPIPRFKGDSVTVAGVPDTFRPVRDAIAELEKKSNQRFFVAIVENSGPTAAAHDAYCQDLLERWQKQGDLYAKQQDSPRNVVVVASIKTRRIKVIPSKELHDRLGLTGPVVTQELINVHFVPKAKAGDFNGAMIALLRGTDQWIVQHEKALAQREEADRVREAALKTDFASGATQARARLDAAEAAWKVQKGRGVQSPQIEADLRDARAALAAAEQGAGSSVRKAYVDLHRAEDLAGKINDRLQGISVAQGRILTELPAAEAKLQQVKAALYQQKEAGLPTAAAERRLAEATEGVAAARKIATEKPVEADAAVVQLQGKLTDLAHELEALPQKAARLEVVRETSAAQEKQLETLAGEVSAYGAGPALVAKSILARVHSSAEAASAATALDLDASIRSYEALTTQIAGGRSQLVAARDDAVYWGRTFPFTVAVVIAAAAAAVALGVWLRSRSARGRAEAAFRKYKESIVEFSARLDELRDRHQNLPASDPDFKEPIVGETLQVYNDVQKELSALRDKWLELMERWEKAQALIQGGGTFAVARYKEAADAVALDVHLKPELDALEQKCAQPLADLELAHERTTEQLQKLRARQDAVQKQLDALSAAKVSTQTLAAGLAAQRVKADAWEKAMVADPLGVRRRLTDDEPAWSGYEAAVSQTFDAWKRWTAASAEHARLTELLAQDVSRGWKYPDPQGRPQNGVDEAGRVLGQAWDALDHGRAADLGPLLDTAERKLKTAAELREKLQKLRDGLPNDLVAAREESQKVGQAIEAASAAFRELTERHDPATWTTVKDYVRQAETISSEFDAAADQVAAEASLDQQQYLSAARRLAALRDRQVEARGLVLAVSRLHGELTGMARESQEKLAGLGAKRQELALWFKSNRRDIQPAAVKRFDEASAALSAAEDLSRAKKPNWVQTSGQVRFAEKAFADARSAGEKDMQNAGEVRRLRTRLEEERNRIKRFLESNIHDRPSANSRFQTAVQRLTRSTRDLDAAGDGPADWDRLRDQLTQVDSQFKEAEEMAREDIRLATEAERALERAAGAFHRTEGFYRSGVKAESSGSSRLLAAAREAVRQQRYEEAIEQAAQAESAAEDARRQAERDALRYEQEQAALRRQRSGGADLTTIVVGNIIGQVAGQMINQAAFGNTQHHHHHHTNDNSWGGGSWPDNSSSNTSSGGGWEGSGGSYDSSPSSGGDSSSNYTNDGGSGSW